MLTLQIRSTDADAGAPQWAHVEPAARHNEKPHTNDDEAGRKRALSDGAALGEQAPAGKKANKGRPAGVYLLHL
jgi:hypothetical protein